MITDFALLLLIKTLRLYTVYTPWDKGRWRIASLLSTCARHLTEGRLLLIRSRDGRRFRIDPREPQYHIGLLDRGVFEPEETSAMAGYLFSGAVAVDVGANYGWYTTLFSRLVGDEGSVHAFEPMPHTAAALKENCRLSDCRNVIINQCALGEREGSATIYHHRGRACGDASLFPITHGEVQPYHCEIRTLDSYFSEHQLSRCDLIKCDVEGGELLFLRGASHVVHKYRPTILLEVNPTTLQRAGGTGSDLLEELERYGEFDFMAIGGSTGWTGLINPDYCKGLDTYINVLCLPRSPDPTKSSR